MKTRFIFFFLFATTTILAQTKLCEESAVGYSVCFNLEKDSIFSFEFNHCTGSTLGIGKYTKNKKTLTFVFDTLVYPRINKYYDKELTNMVKITTYGIKNESPLDFIEMLYLDKVFYTDFDGSYSFDYSGGSITIKEDFGNSIVINPEKDLCNNYEIFMFITDDSYVEGGTIVKMKKVGEKYKLKEKVRFNKKKRGEQEYYLKWTTKYYVER